MVRVKEDLLQIVDQIYWSSDDPNLICQNFTNSLTNSIVNNSKFRHEHLITPWINNNIV